MPDFIPNTDGDMQGFLRNLKVRLPKHQKDLGLSDAQVKDALERGDELIASLDKNEGRRSDYLAQTAATRALKAKHIPALRGFFRLVKALPGYSEEIGVSLGILAPSTEELRGDDLKGECEVSVHRGFVRVQFTKQGCDGVNVYSQLLGDKEWRFLARDTNSPYDDYSPLQKAGTPEVRLYRVILVDKDEEVGSASDAVTVTFSG